MADTATFFDDWTTTTDSGSVSFAVGEAEPAEPVMVWRVAGEADLLQREAKQSGLKLALVEAPARLQTLTRQIAASGGTASFSVGEDTPEAELAQLMGDMQTQVHFAAGEEGGVQAPPSWNMLGGQFNGALEQVQRLLVYAAWVETQVDGELLGRSIVTWTGDTQTIWLAERSARSIGLHSRNMRLAIASRATLIRTVFIAAQGAAKIAATLSLPPPAGPIAALPVAWNFVSQIMAEIKQYQTLAKA